MTKMHFFAEQISKSYITCHRLLTFFDILAFTLISQIAFVYILEEHIEFRPVTSRERR